jgi:hypothetical protein
MTFPEPDFGMLKKFAAFAKGKRPGTFPAVAMIF